MSATKQMSNFTAETVIYLDSESLSEDEDSESYTIHGVALGAGDTTVGQSGIRKVWPAEELQRAAETLKETALVEDHDNSARGVVGRVTKAGYKEGVGVIYEAELYDEELADKINKGLLEVSVRGFHDSVDDLPENDDGAKVVAGIQFDNLSIVRTGAAPSNTVAMGGHEELSLATLAQYTSDLQEGVEVGDFVQWDDMNGIVFQIEEGEAVVEVMEESDGMWRSVSRQETVSVGDLDMWSVDEDDIGEPKESEDESSDTEEGAVTSKDVPTSDHHKGVDDEEESEEDEEPVEEESEDDLEGPTDYGEGDLVQWESTPEKVGGVVHVDEERQVVMVEVLEREGDEWVSTGYTDTAAYTDVMPVEEELNVTFGEELGDSNRPEGAEEKTDGDDKEGQPHRYPDESSESVEQASAMDGNWVKFRGVDNQWVYGQIVGSNDNGSRSSARVRLFTESGDKLDETVEKPSGLLHKWDMNPDTKPDSHDDMESVVQTDWESGEMVKVRAAPGTFGRVAAVDDKTKTVLIKVMSKQSGKLGPTGHTMTIGFGDVAPVGNELSVDEMSQAEEALQSYEMHTPDWSGTTESDWSSPDMEDFDTDDLSEVDDHFLISQSGFPPENFGDLKLPVVEPSGDLNVNALAAVKGGRGVSAVDGLGETMETDIVEWVNMTANNEFEKDWGEQEEASGHMDEESDDGGSDEDGEVEMESHQFESKDDAMAMAKEMGLDGVHKMDDMWMPGETHEDYLDAVESMSTNESEDDDESADEMSADQSTETSGDNLVVLSGDDLYQRTRKNGESTKDSDETNTITTMNVEELKAKVESLDEPAAVEQSDLEELQAKAEKYDSMEEDIASLRERTEVLDSVDKSQVEELAEAEDAVILDGKKYEELTGEAEQVKQLYAESLEESVEVFDAEELMERYDIGELRSKYEALGGSVEEELSSEPAPKSTDASEEELSEETDEDSDEEQLSDEVSTRQDELRKRMNLTGGY